MPIAKRAVKKGKKAISFDDTIFHDAVQPKEFLNTRFALNYLLLEREVLLNDSSQTSIPGLFLSRDWESLLVSLSPPSEMLVRDQFY